MSTGGASQLPSGSASQLPSGGASQLPTGGGSLSPPGGGSQLPTGDGNTNTNNYVYIDGTTATFFIWEPGEPNFQDTELCIRLTAADLNFRTTNCSFVYGYVCEGKHDTTTSLVSKEKRGHIYLSPITKPLFQWKEKTE